MNNAANSTTPSSSVASPVTSPAAVTAPGANANGATGKPAAPVDVTPQRRWIIFSGLMLATVMASLDQSIVSTALPTIAGQLGGLTHMTWVVTAFMLTSTISAPLYGKFSDMYGRSRLFAISIVVFLISSLLCGIAQNMWQLILFRGMQGLGAGGLITLSQTIVGSIVPSRERGRYQGLFTGAFAVSSVTGPLLGGFITTTFSWRWVFLINLPFGIAALALVLTALPLIHQSQRHRIDYAGAALLTLGTSAFLLLFNTSGSSIRWDSPLCIALLLTGVLAFFFCIRVERRAAEPILNLTLFRIPAFTTCVFASGMMSFAMMGTTVFLPLYFQLVLGMTPTESGAMMLPQVACMLLSSIIGGQISTRTRRFSLLLSIGVFLEALSLMLIALLAHLGSPFQGFAAVLGLMGTGMGIAMPNATVVVQNVVPQNALGIATATMSFVRSLGGSLGVALSGGVMAVSLRLQLSDLPASFPVDDLLQRGMSAIRTLSPSMQTTLINAWQHAIGSSLIAGGLMMFCAFLPVLRLTLRQGGKAEA